MGKKMVYRTAANHDEKGKPFGEKMRLVGLRAGTLIPLSLTCSSKLLVEPHASDRDRVNAANKIIKIGELDELFEAFPKIPFHMQKQMAQRIILRISRDIDMDESTPVDGLYKRKTTSELRNEAKEKVRKLVESPGISIEAKQIFEEFLKE
jgi:hypothetical protein